MQLKKPLPLGKGSSRELSGLDSIETSEDFDALLEKRLTSCSAVVRLLVMRTCAGLTSDRLIYPSVQNPLQDFASIHYDRARFSKAPRDRYGETLSCSPSQDAIPTVVDWMLAKQPHANDT
jgi:hypothetical protein